MQALRRIERIERGRDSKKTPLLIVELNNTGTYSNYQATYTRAELDALERKYGFVLVLDM